MQEELQKDILNTLHKESAKERFAKEYVCHFEETNPCAEMLYIPRQMGKTYASYEFLKERGIPMTDNNTPHSLRIDRNSNSNEVNVSGDSLSGRLIVTDETGTLRVQMPGVPLNRLEVRQIDNILRIRVNPAEDAVKIDPYTQRSNVRELSLILAPEEEITDVNLALGILEISIDRGREIVDFEVNETN